MKKMVAICLSLVMCGSLFACTPKPQEGGSPDDGTSGDTTASQEYFVWNALDDTVIEGYTELGLEQTELVIPANCTSVEQLGDNPNVKKITFENPDTVIQNITFSGCTALEQVELPANLEEVPKSCFYGCESLQTVEIPAKVTEIGESAFLECTSLESVTLPEGLEIIGWESFSDCTALQEVVIPDSVTTIAQNAFRRCEGLASVTFGTGLTTVGESAFEKCNSLKSVKLPEGVTTLGNSAFGLCDAIEEIYVPASIVEAEFDALVQTHPTKIYVVEGSYMDGRLSEMMGVEMFEKLYQ